MIIAKRSLGELTPSEFLHTVFKKRWINNDSSVKILPHLRQDLLLLLTVRSFTGVSVCEAELLFWHRFLVWHRNDSQIKFGVHFFVKPHQRYSASAHVEFIEFVYCKCFKSTSNILCTKKGPLRERVIEII